MLPLDLKISSKGLRNTLRIGGEWKKCKKDEKKDYLLKHIQGLDKNIDDGIDFDVILAERIKDIADLLLIEKKDILDIYQKEKKSNGP